MDRGKYLNRVGTLMIKFQEVTIKLQKLIRTTDETLSNLRMKINVHQVKIAFKSKKSLLISITAILLSLKIGKNLLMTHVWSITLYECET